MPEKWELKDGVVKALEKKRKLTQDDLQALREGASTIPEMTGVLSSWFDVRMAIELTDAIRSMDETSSTLVTETNRLTKAIFWLTVIGVVLTIVNVLVALFA